MYMLLVLKQYVLLAKERRYLPSETYTLRILKLRVNSEAVWGSGARCYLGLEKVPPNFWDYWDYWDKFKTQAVSTRVVPQATGFVSLDDP
jgi:hypothetical protein